MVANSSCLWLLGQLWEIVSLLVFERKYLCKSFGGMNYVEGCGFHEILMLQCPIFCLSLSTFYGKI
jgi:hypothetical protein